MTRQTWTAAALGILLMVAVPPLVAAPKDDGAKGDKKAGIDSYEAMLQSYLEAARQQGPRPAVDPTNWMNSLMSDPRARHVDDLLTINVVESITASGTADSAVSKASAAAIAVPNLFGLE